LEGHFKRQFTAANRAKLVLPTGPEKVAVKLGISLPAASWLPVRAKGFGMSHFEGSL